MIQVLVVLYSFVGVLSKTASGILVKSGMFSVDFVGIVFSMLVVLGTYAIFWQKILKKIELSIAYLNKAFSLFWSLLWSLLFFGESIHWNQIFGIVIIVLGIIVVSNYDK